MVKDMDTSALKPFSVFNGFILLVWSLCKSFTQLLLPQNSTAPASDWLSAFPLPSLRARDSSRDGKDVAHGRLEHKEGVSIQGGKLTQPLHREESTQDSLQEENHSGCVQVQRESRAHTANSRLLNILHVLMGGTRPHEKSQTRSRLQTEYRRA